jgi:hypothetical protein
MGGTTYLSSLITVLLRNPRAAPVADHDQEPRQDEGENDRRFIAQGLGKGGKRSVQTLGFLRGGFESYIAGTRKELREEQVEAPNVSPLPTTTTGRPRHLDLVHDILI